MIYRSGVFSKKAGISLDAFRDHWFEIHGEIASRLPGLRSYRQNHIRERLFEEVPFRGHAMDGISLLRFDDIAAMEVAEKSAVYVQAKIDIPKFQGAITILVLGEDGAAGQHGSSDVKVLVISSATNSLDAAPADSERANSLLGQPGVSGPVGVVLNRVIDRAHPVSAGVPQGELPIARIDELWFVNFDALSSWAKSPEGMPRLFEDASLKPMAIYAVDEVTVV